MDALQIATQAPRHRFPSNSLRPLRGPVVARHLVRLSMRTEVKRRTALRVSACSG